MYNASEPSKLTRTRFLEHCSRTRRRNNTAVLALGMPTRRSPGSKEWARPLLDMRLPYKKTNGCDLPFTFMRIGHAWELVAAQPAAYSAAKRKLTLLAVALGDAEGGKYTLHSPANLFPTASNQLRSDRRELITIGHSSSTSKMPDPYDRSARANVLLLRNTIAQSIQQGWSMTGSFAFRRR